MCSKIIRSEAGTSQIFGAHADNIYCSKSWLPSPPAEFDRVFLRFPSAVRHTPLSDPRFVALNRRCCFARLAGGGPDLPSSVPGVAATLSVQPHQDDQDEHAGHSEHARAGQAYGREDAAHEHL